MSVLLEILIAAILAIAVARLAKEPWRGRGMNLLKAYVTVRAFMLLLLHPVSMEDGSKKIAWELILETLRNIDAGTFWLFVALAAGIKFVGILASMYRWHSMLRGQDIRLPFRHIFGSFLIGRFIGTFLPSTAGLDGYTLYDAARFSGQTVEVTAAKMLEKVVGIFGIFLSFLVALPFGIKIFGENGPLVAAVTVPLALGLLTALMLVLWYPGIVQWLIEHIPLPGKARLEGLVMRISHAAAAYRTKKPLVFLILFLSFVVHFTTAAMYYFTALAIGAQAAEFWPIAFGSSIQIFATVVSPFTIAGEGIREAAQYALLGNMIGPANAIVSAALGFWAAEALTLLGGVFWWVRPADYAPAYCLVNGEQVDYEEAARAAVALETEADRQRHRDRPAAPPYRDRAHAAASYGLGGGLLAGVLLGLGEALAVAATGLGTEAQVLWYAPVTYALFFGALGAAGGIVLAALPMDLDEIRGWTPSLAWIVLLVPLGLAVTVFRLRRDVYLEQMPPAPVLVGVLAAFGAFALLLFFLGPKLFRSRFGALAKPLHALGLVALVGVGGAIASRSVPLAEASTADPAPVAAALRERPNLILVMVDTLRADHLSCYGDSPVATPNLCRIATDGGSLFDGYAHSSWTKPSTASLLTSLVPTSHQTMSKPSALPDEIETVAEVLQQQGYATGGFVSNTNLTESFGFAQGFDEYHYLGPDYLAGAKESSSKLVLYQIGRRVWFTLPLGLSFGDFYQDSEVVNGHAFDWLARHSDSRFFLFLHYMDPHDPYFEHPYDGSGIARAGNQHPKPALAEEMHRLYLEEIAYLDENFGRMLSKLEELGLYDDTVIALVADHGEEFYEHGGFWHGLTLYDEQIRVPFLIKWAKGRRGAPIHAREGLARIIDVAPTLLAQAGASAPAAMQGRNLTEGVASNAEADNLVYSEEDHEGNVLQSVRTKQFKWISANEGNPRGLPTLELFQIDRDPGETKSVHEAQPGVVERLAGHARGQQQLAATGKVGEARTSELSAEERAALIALGYLQEEEPAEEATP